MPESWSLVVVGFAGLAVGVLLVSIAMAAGYWAGRNSRELPFRSGNNPRPTKQEPLKTATGEPDGGDVYNDAAFGEDRRPVSTINTGA
jgi:hypothetical protein